LDNSSSNSDSNSDSDSSKSSNSDSDSDSDSSKSSSEDSDEDEDTVVWNPKNSSKNLKFSKKNSIVLYNGITFIIKLGNGWQGVVQAKKKNPKYAFKLLKNSLSCMYGFAPKNINLNGNVNFY
jgi:hypothetical protein